MDYEVKQIVTPEQRQETVAKLQEMPSEYYHQDYNLHDVTKWAKGINKENFPMLKSIEDLFPDLKVYSHYFLEYGVDSFTKQHTDNDKLIEKTVVTLVESVDLIGGETIVLKTYNIKGRPATALRKGGAMYGYRIIPEVVKLEDGDSIIYDHSLPHSVAQVTQGKRLVLVSWFTSYK